MGFQLEGDMNADDHKLKSKSKKNKDLVSEGEEPSESFIIVKDQTPKKAKKRHTTVYPQYFSDCESGLGNKRSSSFKLQSDTVLISDEVPSSNEMVFMKTKKKKKERERENFQVVEEQDSLVISEGEADKEEDVELEQTRTEENDDELRISESEHKIPQGDEDFYDGWSKEDLQELFTRMSQAIPKNDCFKATSRLQKLDWEQIKFNNYTAADCQEKWRYVEKKVRGFRLLSELLSDANTWLEKPWTDFYRSEKKNRHPSMPKRPLTSFMLFYMDKKKRFAKKYPNLEMSKLSKIMAEKFHTLPENKREKYKKLAIAMREEYNEKMQKFLEEHPKEAMQLKKSVKKEKVTVSGPKKPETPFKMFYQEKVKRLKEEDMPTPPDFMVQCKEKWKHMSNRKKMPWIRWAHEAEVKYLEEVKLYLAENPNFEAPPFKSVLSKAEKDILDRVEGKPEKPPNSAYSLFSRLMLKDPNIKEKFETPKQRLQEIAKLWKEVPLIEREEYAEKVKHLLENYKLEYATYLDSLPEDKREEELASNVPKKKTKPDGTSHPKKKVKQTSLDVLKNTPVPARDSLDKDKRMKLYTAEDLMAMEPPQTPTEPFILFRDEYLKKGLSEKKAIKAWALLSNVEKRNYELRLELMKNEYITNYRDFLKRLKPEELKLYSQIREKGRIEQSLDDEEEEEEIDEEEAESSTVSQIEESDEST